MNSPDNHPFHWHYAELDDKNFQIHGQSLLLLLILFSILLLFTLICLYTRWACRYRQSTAGAAATAQQQQQQQQQQGLQLARSVGLDRATIESLPVYLHRSSASEVQCSICLSSFQEEEKVKVLPECNHAFHPECVDMWLKTHSSCPLCRASLGVPAEVACTAA